MELVRISLEHQYLLSSHSHRLKQSYQRAELRELFSPISSFKINHVFPSRRRSLLLLWLWFRCCGRRRCLLPPPHHGKVVFEAFITSEVKTAYIAKDMMDLLHTKMESLSASSLFWRGSKYYPTPSLPPLIANLQFLGVIGVSYIGACRQLLGRSGKRRN